MGADTEKDQLGLKSGVLKACLEYQPDLKARHSASCLLLVYKIANEMRGRVPPSLFDDLVQEGCIGLIKAEKGYDPTKMVPFSVWAVMRIRWSMFDFVRRIKPHVSLDPGDWDPVIQDREPTDFDALFYGLTPRARVVYSYLAEGFSRPEIARKMGISLGRVGLLVRRSRQLVGARIQRELDRV